MGNDYIGFRAKTEAQKREFYKRSENLKAKGYTKSDIFKAGLLALEKGESEQQLIYQKIKAINERDKYLMQTIALNEYIEAKNRRLKDKFNSRYKELNINDGVIILFDSNGNKIKKV